MTDSTRPERRDLRTRTAMEVLGQHPEGLPWPELWPLVEAQVPVEGSETVLLPGGKSRAENDLSWQMVNLDKAGWVLTAVPRPKITREGRQALVDFPDAHELAASALVRYQEWDRVRKESSVSVEVAPPGGILRAEVGEAAMLSTAKRILDDGLRGGGSAFRAGASAWSADSVAALKVAFVDAPDASSRSFVDKLAGQLAESDDDTILLAAEMLALIVLPLADWKPDTKRQRVKSILALMRDPVHIPMDVSAAMDFGVFNGSLAFKTLLWRALATVVGAAASWWQIDDASRSLAWSDPWRWRSLIDEASEDSIPAARAELCYLKFPGTFLPIVSHDHKLRIRDAFADELEVPAEDLDRDLRAITLHLQEQARGPIDFYRPPYRDRWEQPGVDAQPSESVGRAWLVRGSSVKGVDLVPTWLGDGFVSLAASQLGAIDDSMEDADLRVAVDTGYDNLGYSQKQAKFDEVRTFVRRLKPGHLVLTNSGERIYLGEVAGGWEQVESRGGRSNLRRAVSWLNPEAPIDLADLPDKVKGKLRSSSDVVDLTDVADLLRDLPVPVEVDDEVVDGGDQPPVRLGPLAALADSVSEGLLVSRPWLDELVALLDERKQLILYGPPGTGKTYLAQRVAEAVAGPERVRLVQFHPAYSYEDFFEGYRPAAGPDGQVAFRLVPGPFRKTVDDALEDPGSPFVLIIDEINRANLAKVFGELYFLLEYRDQTIDLMYSSGDEGRQFTLPDNVFVIGTMNTADRSIALVDAAMRRRFAFLSLHPDDEHLSGVLPRWLADQGLPAEPAFLLAELNRRIPDKDFKIGPSYLMRTSVGDEVGLERIWRTSILPLLEEFHFGDDVDVERRYGLAALRAAIGSRVEPEEAEAVQVESPGEEV